MHFCSMLRSLVLSAAVASSALASTYIVDANGTGQFTNIPPAIAAAQDGDVIIVMPGAYSPFTLTKSLTIVGRGNVSAIGSNLAISNIPAGNLAAVVNLRASGLSVANCAGHVIVQDVTPAAPGAPFTLAVTSSADVRLRGLTTGSVGPQSSRIEMTRCTIEGASGAPAPSNPWDGEPGLASGGGNLLHMVSTTIVGGNGGDADSGWAGNGGTALILTANDLAIFSGGLLQGGSGGWSPTGFPGLPCFYTGFGAPAAWVTPSATFRHSTSSLEGGYSTDPATCSAGQVAWNSGSGTFVQATPGDPNLDFVGIPVPGFGVQFVVYARRAPWRD